MSKSGEEMLSINTRDTTGIRMLQKEDVEVGVWERDGSMYWLELCNHTLYPLCVSSRWCCWPAARTPWPSRWLTSWRRGRAATWSMWGRSRWMFWGRWWRRRSCSGRTWRTWVKTASRTHRGSLITAFSLFSVTLSSSSSSQVTTNQMWTAWTWRVWVRCPETLPWSPSTPPNTPATTSGGREPWGSSPNTSCCRNRRRSRRWSRTASTSAASDVTRSKSARGVLGKMERQVFKLRIRI